MPTMRPHDRTTPLSIRISALAAVAALALAWPSAAPPSDAVRRSAVSGALGPDHRDEVVIAVPQWHGLVVAEGGLTTMGPTTSGHASAAAPPAPPVTEGVGVMGIPEIAYAAYLGAEISLTAQRPSCHLDWQLLAAIGRVESNHGRFGGARLHLDGTSVPAIRGIPLDGRPGVALIADTDKGSLDGDVVHDRAVGPMQFIPGTWRAVFPTGNPDNIFDAALAAGRYLCAAGGDLRDPDERAAAVMRYNHSSQYVALVIGLADQYRAGTIALLPSAGDLAVLAAPPPDANASAPRTAVAAPPANTTTAPGPTGTTPSTSTTTAQPTTTAPTTTTPPPTTTPPTTTPPTTAPPATTPPAPPSATPPPTTEVPPSSKPPSDCGLLDLLLEC